MQSVVGQVEAKHKKKSVIDVQSGDTVKVHQKIREGGKDRIQIFEGTVIRTGRPDSLTASFTVRRIASGVGVEKTYLIHSPNVLKVEVTKRSKVRRNYLSYMRQLTGKNARLTGVDFDREAVNVVEDEATEEETEKIKEDKEKAHQEAQSKKAEEQAEEEAKFQQAVASHQDEPTVAESKAEPETDQK